MPGDGLTRVPGPGQGGTIGRLDGLPLEPFPRQPGLLPALIV
jgi:hypothetical protein